MLLLKKNTSEAKMKYKNRLLEKKLVELFKYYPVVAVLGARQVGKSTLVENLFRDKIRTVVFDPVVDVGNAREDPDFFLQNIISRKSQEKRKDIFRILVSYLICNELVLR
ncbi:MAG: hypothetical protein JRE64_03370 [Deltaproteobacteria bacterium]|nr:hypothetical protein [Deltaproteobacteria bacterium]